VPEDIVIHCLNYSMWSGGVTDHQCLEKAGAAVIPFGVGNSKYLIETIKRTRPTAISCTPSYLTRLEELLRDDFNETPDSLGLKKALLGGEGGLQQPDYRASIESKWNLQAIDANYGLSDVLSIIGAECPARCGLHFHGQGIVMPELINSQSVSIPIKAGAEGELVLTCLLREGQPIFRYRTRDALRIIDTGTCQCGRSSFLFKVIGRTDDMIDVKGINFFPNALQGTLRRFSEVLSGEYRVVVPSVPFRALGLRVELAGIEAATEELRDRIVSMIRSEHSILVDLEFLPSGSFEKSENKTSRLIRS
jgi:phenylacetate-CoA ligase